MKLAFGALSLVLSFGVAYVLGVPTIIAPRLSEKSCLEVRGGVNADGTPVDITTCGSSTGQVWTLDAGPSKAGTIRIAAWNKCLDVTDGKTANGNKLQIWTCTAGNPNQMFTYPTPPLAIKWARSGVNKCVDLTDGKIADGTPVRLNSSWENWHFVVDLRSHDRRSCGTAQVALIRYGI